MSAKDKREKTKELKSQWHHDSLAVTAIGEQVLRLIRLSGGEMSFAEIGRRLGISRERVRTIARQAGSDVRMRVTDQCARCGMVYTALRSGIREGRQLCPRCSVASQRRAPIQRRSKRITARRAELLLHVAEGKSYQEVADELGLSPNTVKNLMHRVMKEIGARHSAHAVAIAFEHGWIDIGEMQEKHRSQYVADMLPIIEEIKGKLDEANERLWRLEKILAGDTSSLRGRIATRSSSSPTRGSP